MASSSDRQQPWPRYVGRARQLTEETALDHAKNLRDVLKKVEKIQEVAFTDPQLVYQLALLTQRDISLSIAALADIARWMADAQRGRDAPD